MDQREIKYIGHRLARRLPACMLLGVLCALLVGCESNFVMVDRKALRAGGSYVVLPLADAAGAQAEGSGRVMTGAIVSCLLGQPGIKVFHVTESQLVKALLDTGFDPIDTCDPVVAAELGGKLNADYVVCGELIHYAPEKQVTSGSFLVFSGGETKTRFWVSVNLRIVRVSDGRIIYAGNGSAVAPEGYSDAARTACGKALQTMSTILHQQE